MYFQMGGLVHLNPLPPGCPGGWVPVWAVSFFQKLCDLFMSTQVLSLLSKLFPKSNPNEYAHET